MDVDGLSYETRQIPDGRGRVFDDVRNFALFVTKDSEYVEVHRFIEGIAYRPIIFRVGDEFEDLNDDFYTKEEYEGVMANFGTSIRIEKISCCPAIIADIRLKRILKSGRAADLTLSIFSILNYLQDERWRKIV